MTNLQRLTTILTAFNLVLLAFGLAQLRPAVAQGVSRTPRARIGNRGRPGACSCRDQSAAGTTCAQNARWYDGISGGSAIAPDQFAEQPQRETRDDGRRIGVGARRRERTYAIAIAGHGSVHHDRYEGRSGTDDQTVTLGNHLQGLLGDLRFAARSLWRSPPSDY